jgi:hypothetical protein
MCQHRLGRLAEAEQSYQQAVKWRQSKNADVQSGGDLSRFDSWRSEAERAPRKSSTKPPTAAPPSKE